MKGSWDGGADLGASARRDVHARHAEAYPAGLYREAGFVAFGVAHPPHDGHGCLAVGFGGGKLLASRDPGQMQSAGAGAWPAILVGNEIHTCLGLLGVGRGYGEMPAAIADEPPVVTLLAGALVAAWEAEGLDEGMDGGALLWEAREREQSRLDEAGLGVILAALPRGLDRILDSRGDIFGDRAWSRGFLDYALAREGRVAAIARLGDLMDLVEHADGAEDPTDHADPASFVMERIRGWAAGRDEGAPAAGASEAAWLLERFKTLPARGDLATAVPAVHLHALVLNRPYVEDRRLRAPDDAAALLRFVAAAERWSPGEPDLRRALEAIALCDGATGYAGVVAGIASAGGRHGFVRGREHFLVDADRMRLSVRDGIVMPLLSRILEPRLVGGLSPSLSWSLLDGAALGAGMARIADSCVFAGREAGAVALAARAWEEAGAPGRRGVPPRDWIDIGRRHPEIGDRLRAAAALDPAAAHAALSPYLGGAWAGPDGLDRIAAACGALADATVPALSVPEAAPETAPGPDAAVPKAGRGWGWLSRILGR